MIKSESGGSVRDVASLDINTEDFSAAVDYLANRADVNADRIGIIGVCGEKAHSRYFSETAYKALTSGNYAANKELLIVPGASHTDLYDTDKIPFDKITDFFKTNLK